MEKNVLLSMKNDIVAKADHLADELVRTIGCSRVFVSLANVDLLFSIGMSTADEAGEAARIHDAKASVCGVTVANNEQILLADASAESATSRIPSVASGDIVGYLGQPIQDRDGNAIGAICAISAEPRDWSKSDEIMLKATCLEVENMIAHAVFDFEADALSQSLSEYDTILGTLAVHADLKVSIHGMGGDLLFATNALLEQVDEACIEERIRNRKTLDKQDASDPQTATVGRAVASEVFMIQTSGGASTHWIANVLECSNGTLFVCWEAKSVP